MSPYSPYGVIHWSGRRNDPIHLETASLYPLLKLLLVHETPEQLSRLENVTRARVLKVMSSYR